jgi:hypothetical protein
MIFILQQAFDAAGYSLAFCSPDWRAIEPRGFQATWRLRISVVEIVPTRSVALPDAKGGNFV